MSGCLCLRLPGCCGTHGPRPLFFSECQCMERSRGAVPPFDLPTLSQWRQQPLQPHRWTCVKGLMVKTGQPGTPPQLILLTTPQRPTPAFFSIGTDHNLPTTPRPRRKSTPWGQEDPHRALCELPAGTYRPSCPPRHHSRTHPDPDTPPPIASTETMGHL